MVTITERTSKDEVISAAVELTDAQALEIEELRSRQQLLLTVVAILLVSHFLF